MKDPDLLLLQARCAKLRGQIQEYQRQVAANERKMEAFHSRVSELPTVSPDTPAVVTKQVKNFARKKNQDLNSIKRMEELNNEIQDRLVNLIRNAAIVNTDIKERELWHKRHIKLNKTSSCPYPHNRARPSPSSSQNPHPSQTFRSVFPRSESHPEVLMHLNERETIECSVCRNHFDKIDAHDVQLRFAKLKTENFSLRLRRSYSNDSLYTVAQLMENLEDKSTGIFPHYRPVWVIPPIFVLAPVPEEPEDLDEDSDTTLKGSKSDKSSSGFAFFENKDCNWYEFVN